MKQINTKQIIIHFIASLMILLALKNAYLFFNHELLSEIDKFGFEEVYNNSDKFGYSAEDFLWFSINQKIVVWIGILLTFVFSILISRKQKWSVWNSIIIFTLLIFLNILNVLNFPSYYISIGSLFSNWTIRILLNIISFFSIGFYLFFSKRVVSIILVNEK
ncbi:hypothetical protein [Flavobacterium sp. I3-2]|uniref:hypothetical protein n=1 Tax=Flavobacterium sp. I3-2 TaxID=2748319 RepID=UPI0015B05779|nr:hypothetical protein [Flavobacterium sp. I3-2]